ncbi:hypothetical protein [Nocardia sp. NPDC058666]
MRRLLHAVAPPSGPSEMMHHRARAFLPVTADAPQRHPANSARP